MLSNEVFGFTLSKLGEIMIGYSVLRVHLKVKKEHKIDKAVFREITHEQFIVALGILLVIIGYFIELRFKV